MFKDRPIIGKGHEFKLFYPNKIYYRPITNKYTNKFTKNSTKKIYSYKICRSLYAIVYEFLDYTVGQKINFMKFFGRIPFFTISKMAKNHFLNWQMFKTARNAISRKKFLIYLFSQVFLPGLF